MTDKIFLAGDPVTDICVLRMKPRGGQTGQDANFSIWSKPGGVDLMHDTLSKLGFSIHLHHTSKEAEQLQALADLMCLAEKGGKELEINPPPADDDKPLIARIKNYDGYAKSNELPSLKVERPKLGSGPKLETCDAVILNDAGKGLRRTNAQVTNKLKKAESARLLLHKMHHNLEFDSAISNVVKDLKNPERNVLLVSAADVRLKGIRMRGNLSWDAALEDIAATLNHADSPLATALTTYKHIIILFDVEAVACIQAGDIGTRVTFVYHPTSAEGDLSLRRPGSLYGIMNAFTSALLAEVRDAALDFATLLQQSAPPIDQTVNPQDGLSPETASETVADPLGMVLINALASARTYADDHITLPPRKTFEDPLIWPQVTWSGDTAPAPAPDAGTDDEKKQAAARLTAFHQHKKAFGKHQKVLNSISLGLADMTRPVHMPFRLIEFDSSTNDPLSLAEKIVREGDKALKRLPSARIGEFVTLDRGEIESYRALQRMIESYLSDDRNTKPISIGVFGPPGSGKSYGIKQIAKTMDIPIKEFNLSEANEDALPGYFHEIRDLCLKGKTPLCFFDEFDSNERKLVSRFLAPMQDGEFRDGPRVHPVGRSILVFAGGTAQSAAEFLSKHPNGDISEEDTKRKVPDFVSRLGATLDIMGPNRTKDEGGTHSFYLRRAVLMRSMLKQHVPQLLIDGDGRAHVATDVIRSFITATEYKFGARSLEQVLRMCRIPTDQTQFTISDLPDQARLRLHLSEPETFVRGETI